MSTTPPAGSRPPVLICFAVKEETAYLADASLANGVTLITGMGRANAAREVTLCLDRLQPRLVLTCGFAGGLNPAFPTGTVLCDTDAECGLEEPCRQAGIPSARFHEAERVITTVAEKRILRERCGADAVEMESTVIRKLCRARGIPSATLRVISDAADEDLPLDFNRLMTADQKLSLGKLILALLAQPQKIAALIRLQKSTRQAARNLAGALDTIMTALDRTARP